MKNFLSSQFSHSVKCFYSFSTWSSSILSLTLISLFAYTFLFLLSCVFLLSLTYEWVSSSSSYKYLDLCRGYCKLFLFSSFFLLNSLRTLLNHVINLLFCPLHWLFLYKGYFFFVLGKFHFFYVNFEKTIFVLKFFAWIFINFMIGSSLFCQSLMKPFFCSLPNIQLGECRHRDFKVNKKRIKSYKRSINVKRNARLRHLD